MPGGPIDREICCIIELCCGGAGSKQKSTLAKQLHERAGLGHDDASRAAEFLVATYDFAPKEWGLAKFIKKCGEMAREFEYDK